MNGGGRELVAQNGGEQRDLPRLGPKQMINQHEYIRLIEQALYKLGYEAVAKQLEQDSVG